MLAYRTAMPEMRVVVVWVVILLGVLLAFNLLVRLIHAAAYC